MKQNPCACFGYVILENTYPANSVYEVQTFSGSNTLLFLTRGRLVQKRKNSEEVLGEYVAGNISSQWKNEVTDVLAAEETVMFCLTDKLNRGYIPDTTTVILNGDQSANYEAGTKFFLCQGIVKVNGVEFTGPCQIGFKTAQTLEAKTDVYGLIIK